MNFGSKFRVSSHDRYPVRNTIGENYNFSNLEQKICSALPPKTKLRFWNGKNTNASKHMSKCILKTKARGSHQPLHAQQ